MAPPAPSGTGPCPRHPSGTGTRCHLTPSRSLCPRERRSNVFGHPAAALWEASSRFRGAGCSPCTASQPNALCGVSVLHELCSLQGTYRGRKTRRLQDQSLTRELVHPEHPASTPCPLSAGDVGGEVALEPNSRLLIYIFFPSPVSQGGKIYATALFTSPSFLVLLCSDS